MNRLSKPRRPVHPIRLRAKTKHDDQEWVCFSFPPLNRESAWHESWNLDWDTLGQSTGMTDTKAEEIFNGDIVRGYHPAQKKSLTGDVHWSDQFVGWAIGQNSASSFAPTTLEVIGNIYDSPGLYPSPKETP